MDSIPEFYKDRCVFVTGATGFIGKIVVEKLLRSCPDIKKIYVLAREKGNQSPQDRVDALLEQEAFSRAKQVNPGCEKKVVAVPGDITKPILGVEDMMEELAENVSVILHIAATVRFNEPIKVAANMNIRSVQRVVVFASKLKKCDALIHTSTAYAHTYLEKIPEKFLDATYPTDKLLNLLDLVDEDVANAATPALIGDKHPNTYTFTKCCAENYMAKARGNLPVAVVRPSIVCPAWREPFQGWTDTFNGPTGLMTASGTGLLRVVRGERSCQSDTIPVDIVANTLVASAWHTYNRYQNPSAEGFAGTDPVYNCTIGATNPITWGTWVDHSVESWYRYPLEKRLVRSPSLTMFPLRSTWAFVYYWFSFASHYLPGRILDFVARMNGKRQFSAQAYARIAQSLNEYAFFMSHQFTWDHGNVEKMISDMTDEDKENFNIDVKDLHWRTYIDNMTLGIKKYKMSEDISPRRVSQAKLQLRNIGFRGMATRVIAVMLFVRTLISLGYIRGERMFKKSTWVLIFASAMASKQIRDTIFKGMNQLG